MKNIIEINDFISRELDVYARLSEAQLLHFAEPDQGIFIAESPLVIGRALDAGCIPISILMDERQLSSDSRDIQDILKRCEDIPIYTAAFEVLTQLTGFKLTRGMLCAMHRPRMKSLDEICRHAKTVAILENVMNPTNLGAIFRSAAALQVDGIILSGGCTNPLYRRSLRVSMGTVFQIPWTIYEGDSCGIDERLFQYLKEWKFKTLAMALRDNTRSISDPVIQKEEKLAIILGTEGEGLKETTIDACDYTVKIPMAEGVDSLNVAAASAVAFWELSGKRKN